MLLLPPLVVRCCVVRLLPRTTQILLFSATFDSHIRTFARAVAPNAVEIAVKTEELSLDSIKQFFINCSSDQREVHHTHCHVRPAGDRPVHHLRAHRRHRQDAGQPHEEATATRCHCYTARTCSRQRGTA